ncbi:hypothetical protein BDV10DRAFT_15047 [Aspergillus recurvatus]
MSTFLFYNPNSNPTRYSQKARFSERHSILLGTESYALNTEHQPELNQVSASSIYSAQSSTRNNYDLQSAEPDSLEGTRPPTDDNGTSLSEHNISDVQSLHSLFFETGLGASVSSSEVGELIPSSPSQNVQSPFFGDQPVPVNGGACVTQPDSRLDGQTSVFDSDQSSEAAASGPDLATYCLNLSPSPSLRAHDFVVADDHTSGHESNLACPVNGNDPKSSAGSVPPWENDELCTSLNNDEMQVDAENKGTSNGQGIVRLAPGFRQRPETTGLEFTGTSGLSSPCYSNDKDSAGGNTDGPMPDPKFHPLAFAEETCLCGLENSTSLQLSMEDSVPIIAEVMPDSDQGSPTIHAGACSEVDAQGHAIAELTTQEPITEPPVVLADASSASGKSTPAQSSPQKSSHQSCPRRFAEFSHVEIPYRPLPEVDQPSVDIAPTLDQPDRSCHLPGPWRLNGTTLSIDIRDAEQIPIFIGYSSFRVYNGNLTQSLTFFQGLASIPPIKKFAHGVQKPRPPTSVHGPLSSKQKQRLVQLKQEGYTWDEIITKFPGRKRSALQAAYSRSLKNFRTSESLRNQRPRYSPSVPRSSLDQRSLAGIAGNARIEAGRTNQAKKLRYNLRARDSR